MRRLKGPGAGADEDDEEEVSGGGGKIRKTLPKFKVGDKAVYPARGVAEIVAIEERDIGGNKMQSDADFALVWLSAMVPILAVVVVNLVLLSRNGQTIAKRMFGIKVLRTDGSPCSVLRIIFMRWLPVTLLGMLPIIGYASGLIDALMIFGQQQRCLHDLIADTMVVQA